MLTNPQASHEKVGVVFIAAWSPKGDGGSFAAVVFVFRAVGSEPTAGSEMGLSRMSSWETGGENKVKGEASPSGKRGAGIP
jgi:hypothetical protein